jgi:plastocyanin
MISAPPQPPPARVQVVAQEFRYALSRQRITSGWAVIELRNAGEDAHDLKMQRVGGKRVYAWPLAPAGTVVEREFRLLPGTYRLYCSTANHRALGMQATLVVSRRAP